MLPVVLWILVKYKWHDELLLLGQGKEENSMLLLFQVCFIVGVGLTILAFLFGSLFDFLGIDGLDFGSLDFTLPLSPMVYILGITVFGGLGWILHIIMPNCPSPLLVVISLAAGILIAGLFYKGIIVPLHKAENTSAPDQEELIGVIAQVVEKIPENGFGEISYVVNGNTYIAPAKATDNTQIEKKTDVSICWIEEYVFYVSKLDKD